MQNALGKTDTTCSRRRQERCSYRGIQSGRAEEVRERGGDIWLSARACAAWSKHSRVCSSDEQRIVGEIRIARHNVLRLSGSDCRLPVPDQQIPTNRVRINWTIEVVAAVEVVGDAQREVMP